jgi:serine protease Do
MKKFLLFWFALMIMIPGIASAAPKEMSVVLDGKKMTFAGKPIQEKGDLLVPSRAYFQALGAKYSFDGKTQSVKASRKNISLQFIVGQNVAFRNGEAIKLTAKPKLVSGNLYVPLRIGESFGFTFKTKGTQVQIKSPVPSKPPVTTPDIPPTTPAPEEIPQTTGKPRDLSTEEIGKLSNRVVYVEVYNEKGQALGSGSGVVVGSEGEILTNFHVIDGAASAKIDFNNQSTYTTSTMLLKDPERDLALLKIDAGALPAVTIGDSSALVLGQEIVAIGSPLGFKNSLTSGVVSTPSRLVSGQNFIQITAPIDHGSSGGALFNKQGQLVGITTALIQSSASINLAIPSNDVAAFLLKPKTAQALSVPKPQTAKLSADELTGYLNDNYGEITYKDLALHFNWQVFPSSDGERYLIGGTMSNGTEWADWMDYQQQDESVLPRMLYYMSEELRVEKGIEDSFFTFYLNTYFSSYPSSFPTSAITPEYPGYRLDYNFIYGAMEYSTGYLYYNLNPDDENETQRMNMR